MMIRTIAAMLSLACPAAARTALDYEDALRAALVQQGCAFDGAAEGGERRFARQLASTLGVPAAEIMDRRGPHHAALRDAVAALGERGVLSVEGARIALTDCRP